MFKRLSIIGVIAVSVLVSVGCGGAGGMGATMGGAGGPGVGGSGGQGEGTSSHGPGGAGGQGGAAQGTGGAGGGDHPLTDAELTALYQAAVADAKDAEPNDVVNTLVAITPANTTLPRDAQGRVLMVTWTSYKGYDTLVGKDTTLGVEVWTTPGHAFKDFCTKSGLTGAALSLRLEQLLGLPPHNGKDRVVELWVPDAAMFRPSADPEITDSVAQIDFSPGTPQAHIDWYNALKATSYGAKGYPWTRLGYTFDWYPDMSDVGLSEFVVSKGSMVAVNAVATQDEYCKP